MSSYGLNNKYNDIEYIKDCVVPQEYYDQVILKEITEYCQENNINLLNYGTRVLYKIRLYRRYHDDYVFKIGSTENLSERIKQLNREYDCCGRIVIVAAAIINSHADEMYVHNELYEERIPDTKHRELYYLNHDVYNNFINLVNQLPEDNVFISFDYILENDGTELLYTNLSDQHLNGISLQDDMVELDCDINEDRFWTSIRVNY